MDEDNSPPSAELEGTVPRLEEQEIDGIASQLEEQKGDDKEVGKCCEGSNTENSSSISYYRALLEEHEKVKEELRFAKEENSRIHAELESEKERRRLEREERESAIAALVKEKCDIQNQNERVKVEFLRQLEQLQRQCVTANKEKEAIVVKFAQREHAALKLEQQKEGLEKRLSEFGRERDSLLLKIKTLNGEKSRACDLADQKCAELLAAKREATTLRNELSSRDVNLRNADLKLKEEKEINKEMRHRYDLLSQQVREQKNEFDGKMKELQDLVRSYQAAEANKNILADEERMEQQAKLIIDKQRKEDEQSHYKQLLKEVEGLKEVEAVLKEENAALKSQIEVLTADHTKLEENLQKLQEQLTGLQLRNTELQLQVSELESVKLQLDIEWEQCKNLKCDISRLTEVNSELREEIALCSEKESDALIFSQKLTETNVQLQSDLLLAESRASECKTECERLMSELEMLRVQVSSLKEQLESEVARRQTETQLLAVKLAEKTLESDARKKNVDDLLGEISIIKKKHAASVKEMSKELTRLRKRGEGVESISNNSSGDAVSLGSRNSSNSSLNTAGLHQSETVRHASPSPPHGHLIATPEENGHIFNFDDLEDKQQFFIDKILKLQRANARKGEKIDFLEEHVRTLTEEIRKKNRILTGYFMREETGGLTSEKSDKAKIEMAKHGGVMASVYSSRVTDSTVSLELSLEINRKLQALLEDTLLKNITLKESLNTLGDEIARLSQEHHKLLKSKS